MGFPAIDPAEVGITGLFWLFLSYGYVLYEASGLIGEGSELLLLVPSLAGLVGGVVLPLLGAVPDGAIIFFSGLGPIEQAQETLSVGVGALAGSTIMLLTIPFALSVIAGRVDMPDGETPNYMGKPKLTAKRGLESLTKSGVFVSDGVQHASIVMMLTTVPYFLIQVPALFLHGPQDEIAKGEHWWSLLALIICLTGLFIYMKLQLRLSKEGENREKRMAVTRKLLKKGMVSLSGAVASELREQEALMAAGAASEYQAIGNSGDALYPPPLVAAYLKQILADAFFTYDNNQNGKLDRHECYVFFRDFHEAITETEMSNMFEKYDADKSGFINLEEFIGLAYGLIKNQETKAASAAPIATAPSSAMAENAFSDVEEEEVPEEFTALPPDKQQAAIKKRAFTMLFIGTALVVLFSDPMVEVMQEIANRAHLSPFYVSFILAPLASNASEVISSMYYASKKTRKTINVSLSALTGAASMNNTFCLSIFMSLVFFRGLAWQYTAETIAIVVVEVIVGFMLRKESLSTFKACFILSIFPLSIVLVAFLEAIGFD